MESQYTSEETLGKQKTLEIVAAGETQAGYTVKTDTDKGEHET